MIYQIIIFIMPNGDIYFDEPYSKTTGSTNKQFAFRDYFKGAIRTNDTYLGDPTNSASSRPDEVCNSYSCIFSKG